MLRVTYAHTHEMGSFEKQISKAKTCRYMSKQIEKVTYIDIGYTGFFTLFSRRKKHSRPEKRTRIRTHDWFTRAKLYCSKQNCTKKKNVYTRVHDIAKNTNTK